MESKASEADSVIVLDQPPIFFFKGGMAHMLAHWCGGYIELACTERHMLAGMQSAANAYADNARVKARRVALRLVRK